MIEPCGCRVVGGYYKIEYCPLHGAAEDLLLAAEAMVKFLDGLEVATNPADALRQIRQRVHAPLRAVLEPAIAKARAKVSAT